MRDLKLRLDDDDTLSLLHSADSDNVYISSHLPRLFSLPSGPVLSKNGSLPTLLHCCYITDFVLRRLPVLLYQAQRLDERKDGIT